MQNQAIILLSINEWQRQYKNFVYQNAIYFNENAEDPQKEQQLFEQFKQYMKPTYNKYIPQDLQAQQKEVQYSLTKQLKELLKKNQIENFMQLLSMIDFGVFRAEMISQNQMLDLVALELIRKEVGQSSDSDDDDEEELYFEQQRELTKQAIMGILPTKDELKKSIKEALYELQVPQQDQPLVDQLGFNIDNNANEELKKTIKLRNIKFKEIVQKQDVKVTTEELKKRRLQAVAIKKAIQDF
ncbi:hypothetical protein pb186bvf_019415 [Paramecium bursaria]